MGYSKAMLSEGAMMSRSKLQKAVTACKAGSSGCQTAEAQNKIKTVEWGDEVLRAALTTSLLKYKGSGAKVRVALKQQGAYLRSARLCSVSVAAACKVAMASIERNGCQEHSCT